MFSSKGKGKAAMAPPQFPSDAVNQHMHIIIDEPSRQNFLKVAAYPGAALDKIKILEIHVNAETEAYSVDTLARALNEFHPRSQSDNPHKLELVNIVVNGKILFTRYDYHLVSPAASSDVTSNLNKFFTGNLSAEQKAGLAFKVNSTEKVIAKPLLGLRGISNVTVSGDGKMEAGFEETLKRALRSAPGTKTPVLDSDTVGGQYATPGMDRDGEFNCQAYETRAVNPYPSDTESVGGKTRGGNSRALEDLPALNLYNMVPINAKEQDPEDLGFARGTDVSKKELSSTASKGPLPKGMEHAQFVLTGKGNDVELGWKI